MVFSILAVAALVTAIAIGYLAAELRHTIAGRR